MSLRIAVQMDHISTVSIAGDTSFALCLEAQNRGHSLFHYTPDRLSMRDGTVTAACEPMTLRDVEGDHFSLGERKQTDLVRDGCRAAASGSALRHELHHTPPMCWSGSTRRHWWSTIRPGCATVREKIFVTEYPDLMPETLISKDPDEIAGVPAGIRRHHSETALRQWPVPAFFHLTDSDRNFSSLLEMFDTMFREPIIAQRYLKDGARRRQAHHPDRRRAGGRDQPRPESEHDVRSNMPCRRPCRKDRHDRAANWRFAPVSARR